MVEKEPQFKIEAEPSKEKFGKNVEIHAIFVRHGEKAKAGELTEEGKKQATEFGAKLKKKTAVFKFFELFAGGNARSAMSAGYKFSKGKLFTLSLNPISFKLFLDFIE